jgi:hypothetical protein
MPAFHYVFDAKYAPSEGQRLFDCRVDVVFGSGCDDAQHAGGGWHFSS